MYLSTQAKFCHQFSPRYIDLGLWNPVTKILDPICKSCLELVVGSSFIADLNKGGYVEVTFNHPSSQGVFDLFLCGIFTRLSGPSLEIPFRALSIPLLSLGRMR